MCVKVYWIVSFIVSWIVFFMLVDYKLLKKTIAIGFITVVLQLYVDYYAGKYGLYKISNAYITLFDSSAFFAFGIPFTLGIIFVQYLPRNRSWLKLINVLVWSSLFLAFEMLAIYAGILTYTNWNTFNSFTVNVSAFIILGWIWEMFAGKHNVEEK